MDNHVTTGAAALCAFFVASIIGAYFWPNDRGGSIKRNFPPCAIAGSLSAFLSLCCFVWLLHRLFFSKREFSIGSEFVFGPSAIELLTWAGVALAGGAVGFCIQALRREPKSEARATALVSLHAAAVWTLLLAALWGRVP